MMVSARKSNMMVRWNTCKHPRGMWGRIRRKSPIFQVAQRRTHRDDYSSRLPTLSQGQYTVQWYDNRDSSYVQFSTTVKIKNLQITISKTISKTTHDKCLRGGNNGNFSGFGRWDIDVPVDLVYDGIIATGDRRKAVNLRAFNFRCHGVKKCDLGKAMAFWFATGLFMQILSRERPWQWTSENESYPLCSTGKLRLLRWQVPVAMNFIYYWYQSCTCWFLNVNTPNLRTDWSTDSIPFPFISLSSANHWQ